MQCFGRTDLRTFITEYALRSSLSFAGFLIDLYVHGADPQAFAAVDTLILITVDAQQRKITHGLEEYRDGTQIFAERPVILERKCQRNACDVIKRVPGKEQPEHDLLQIGDLYQKQPGHQCKG